MPKGSCCGLGCAPLRLVHSAGAAHQPGSSFGNQSLSLMRAGRLGFHRRLAHANADRAALRLPDALALPPRATAPAAPSLPSASGRRDRFPSTWPASERPGPVIGDGKVRASASGPRANPGAYPCNGMARAALMRVAQADCRPGRGSPSRGAPRAASGSHLMGLCTEAMCSRFELRAASG